MKTPPAIITDLARYGPDISFLLDIVPNASDSWTTKRLATKSCTVDGNAYTAGIISSISPIKMSADLEMGGCAETTDQVTIRLNTRYGTAWSMDALTQDRIQGRQVYIYLSVIPPNLILNASFEKYDGSNRPTFWTIVADWINSFVLSVVAGYAKFQSRICVAISNTAGATTPKITSTEFTIHRGGNLNFSWWQRSNGSVTTVRVRVVVGGYYLNYATRQLQVADTYQDFTSSTYDVWEKKVWGTTWVQLIAGGSGAAWNNTTTHRVTCSVSFEFITKPGITELDGVQMEEHAALTEFYPNRADLHAEHRFLRWAGTVTVPKWNKKEFTIVAKALQAQYHKEIPVARVGDGLGIPQDSQGKPYPMTYGQTKINEWDHVGPWGIPPDRGKYALHLGILVSNSPYAIQYDRPGMKLYQIRRVVHWDGQRQRYYIEFEEEPLNSEGGWPAPTNTPDWVKYPDNAKAEEAGNSIYLKRDLIGLWAFYRPISPYGTGGGGSWTDIHLAGDRSMAAGSYAEYNSSGNNYGYISGFAEQGLPESEVTVQKIWWMGAFETTFGTGGTRTIETRFISLIDHHVTTWRQVYSGSMDRAYDNCAWGIDRLLIPYDKWTDWLVFENVTGSDDLRAFEKASRFAIQHKITHAGVTPDPTYGITTILWEAGLMVEFVMSVYSAKLCGEVSGREFQDSWGGRRTAGNMIEHPVDIIESILRDELSVPAASIDTASFDVAKSGWTITGNGQVIKIRDSEDVVDQICQEFGLLSFFGWDLTTKIRRLRYTNATVTTLTISKLVLDSIECEAVDAMKAFNKVWIKWGWHRHEDSYAGVVYCNKAESYPANSTYEAKCLASYNAIGRENPLEIESQWTNYDSAVDLLKWIIDWTAKPRVKFKCKVSLEYAGLEVGDMIPRPVLPPGYIPDSVPADSKFILTEISIDNDRHLCNLAFVEVPNPA